MSETTAPKVPRLEEFSIAVSGMLLSDVWFNFQHDNWASLFHGGANKVERLFAPTDTQRREAIGLDADDFLICCGLKPEEHADFRLALVEDFLRRV